MTLTADPPVVSPATALRLRPIPVREPRPAVGVLPPVYGTAPAQGQGVLPFEPPPAAVPPGPPDLSGVTRAGRAAPRRTRRGLPDRQEWALQFGQVALEVAGGLRPPGQLVRWVTPPVLAALTRRHGLAQRGSTRRPMLRSLRVCEPSAAVAEVAAVVADGARVRALAFRMEGEDGHWRVTAFELG